VLIALKRRPKPRGPAPKFSLSITQNPCYDLVVEPFQSSSSHKPILLQDLETELSATISSSPSLRRIPLPPLHGFESQRNRERLACSKPENVVQFPPARSRMANLSTPTLEPTLRILEIGEAKTSPRRGSPSNRNRLAQKERRRTPERQPPETQIELNACQILRFLSTSNPKRPSRGPLRPAPAPADPNDGVFFSQPS